MKRAFIAAAVCLPALAAPGHATGPPACLGEQLTARTAFEGGSGAQEGGVMLRNRSAHSCLLGGRATVDFSVEGTSPLAVSVLAGRATDGRKRHRPFVLAPRQRAFVHARWSNWCGPHYDRVTVRLWLMSVEPRVRVRGTISPPRCDDPTSVSRVAIGPYERARIYHPS